MDDDELMFYGPEVYERLSPEDRPLFDAEWERVLTRVGDDLDLAPVVSMLSLWWEAAGGDPEHAAAVRDEFAAWSRARRIGGKGVSGDVVCACVGPAIHDALPEDLAGFFTRRMARAAEEVVATRDWSPLWSITVDAYLETQVSDVDRAAVAVELAEIEAELVAGTPVGAGSEDA